MRVYVFVMRVVPTAGTPQAHGIGGAIADVWVRDTDLDSARAKAVAFVMDYSWVIQEMQHELEPTAEQIQNLRADAFANYHQALSKGISAFFSAYPPKDRDDDVVEIRTLGVPPNPAKTKH